MSKQTHEEVASKDLKIPSWFFNACDWAYVLANFVQEWRTFCNKFEKEVNNFNYGALLRLDPLAEYSENNTIFGRYMRKKF